MQDSCHIFFLELLLVCIKGCESKRQIRSSPTPQNISSNAKLNPVSVGDRNVSPSP